MMILYLAPGALDALAAGAFAVRVALATRIAGPERTGVVLRTIEAAAKEPLAPDAERNGRIGNEA